MTALVSRARGHGNSVLLQYGVHRTSLAETARPFPAISCEIEPRPPPLPRACVHQAPRHGRPAGQPYPCVGPLGPCAGGGKGGGLSVLLLSCPACVAGAVDRTVRHRRAIPAEGHFAGRRCVAGRHKCGLKEWSSDGLVAANDELLCGVWTASSSGDRSVCWPRSKEPTSRSEHALSLLFLVVENVA